MPTRANALAVMAKAPIAGAVKTRLVPFLTAAQAAELARALLLDQLEHLCALDDADLYLAFSPPGEAALMRRLAPPRFEIFPKSQGDLGARMENIFARLFARGYEAALLIGADLAPVPLEYFARAFDYLNAGAPRAVLGPSRDGGYYLVGLNGPQPALFENMTWSHDQVLAQTLAKLAAVRIPVLQLPPWFDIDTPADLTRLRAALDSSLHGTAAHTSQILSALKLPGPSRR